ncbi:cysteine--tRNA ligase [Candidatus Kuenenbacteria bacterium]|nr:cysteine--tRNA ligase [Candidatus Kuenenbacteria bacterium]
MIKIYNTLTRKKEIFKPIEKNKVKFYQCGPTVYWTQHIGNMRAMVLADLILRTFKYLNYDVKFVRNYTDVGHLTSDACTGEDKMEKASKSENLSPWQIAEKYIKIFENDVKELNTLEPNIKTKATEHIFYIIEMVQILIDKKFAYQTDLAIYFDVSKAKNYTKLSRQNLEKQKHDVGSSDTSISDPQKKHPADFVLWFFKKGKHKNALQTWESPLGVGFPGWHIECSVMSNKHLGNTLDIHMGGVEHIPIHHTNEIAQSEAANGVKFVNYWIHNEHLLIDNKKMSKSEGTGYSLEEIKSKRFDPLSLRYFFLQAHYRSKQNFTWKAMKAGQNGLKSLQNKIKALGNDYGKVDPIRYNLSNRVNKKYQKKFIEKISDNFNFPQALAVAQELLKSNLPDKDKLATILDFDKVFGLNLDKISKEGKQIKLPEEIQELFEQRNQARLKKDWKQADKIREKILKMRYEVVDKKI